MRIARLLLCLGSVRSEFPDRDFLAIFSPCVVRHFWGTFADSFAKVISYFMTWTSVTHGPFWPCKFVNCTGPYFRVTEPNDDVVDLSFGHCGVELSNHHPP